MFPNFTYYCVMFKKQNKKKKLTMKLNSHNSYLAIGFKKAVSFLLLLTAVLTGLSTQAQNDTIRKNTVRFNITNPMLFGNKSTILGYERTLKNNKSFSVNIGRASFPLPRISGSDSMKVQNDFKEHGFHISADYRFYLKSVNKYDAPRGIYIGPYYSSNFFNRTNKWDLNTTSFQGELKTNLMLGIHSVGFQLGYQFVFWNRMSVDMILIGPGIAYYSIKANISTSLSEADKQALLDKLNNFLSEKFPGYNQVISGGEFKKSGIESTTSIGFRYMVMLGYRF